MTAQQRTARIGIVGSGFRARTMLWVLHALLVRGERGELRDDVVRYVGAEAAQDQYLHLEVRRAAASGERVRTRPQAWAHGRACRHAETPTQ